MPFDPNFPPDHQELDAAPFRDQFNALNDSLNQLPGSQAMCAAVANFAPCNVDQFPPLTLAVSNPPTQAEVQAILDAFNALVMSLRH